MNNKKRELLFLVEIGIIFLILTFFTTTVNAAYSGYDANKWDTFKNRTKEQIGHEYTVAINTGETYKDGDKSTYYSRTPSLNAPFDEGELKQDTLKAVTAKINYFRYLIGVKPLQQQVTTSSQMQIGALARNTYFDHDISSNPKIEGMSDEMWKKAVYCSHSVLAQGFSPVGSIPGWLNEGYSLQSGKFNTLGHRMSILRQKNGEFNFGYVGKVAIGGEKRTNTVDIPFSAYPAPGYMPLNEISVSSSAWDIEINTNIIQKASKQSDIKVKVTNLLNNKSYECTTSNGKLKVDSMGEYTLMFEQPSGELSYKYSDGEKFKVEVTGLSDKATGKAITLTYTTEFFDVTNYVDNTNVKSANVNAPWRKINISTKMENEESLNKISNLLPNTVDVNTEVGRKATLPLSGKWVLDMKNKCWTNSVNKKDIPSFMKDPEGKLKTIKIEYNIEDILDYSKLAINNAPRVETSDKITMGGMYVIFSGSKVCELYHINKDSKVTKKFNTSIEKNATNCSFDVKSYSFEDTGTYIGVFYSDTYAYQSRYGVYIVGIEDVDVKEKYPLGDVNGDGSVTLADYTKVLAHVKKTKMLTQEEQKRADVNQDGKITLADYTKILAHVKKTKLLE